MKARRTAADEAKPDAEPSFVKSWGGQRNQSEQSASKEPAEDVS